MSYTHNSFPSFCPIEATLEENSLVFIPVGRPHSFEKEGTDMLTPHSLGIAWDRISLGPNAESINREVAHTLEATKFNRTNRLESLGLIDLVVYQSVKHSLLRLEHKSPANDSEFEIHPEEQLRGLLPSLEYIVTRDLALSNQCMDSKYYRETKSPNDIDNDPFVKVDRRDNTGYCCCRCQTPVANAHMHCVTCEDEGKDFNICLQCFLDLGGKRTKKKFSNKDDFFGCNPEGELRDHFSPGKGRKRKQHDKFDLYQRFFDDDHLLKLLDQAKKAVGNKQVPHAAETLNRLKEAKTVFLLNDK